MHAVLVEVVQEERFLHRLLDIRGRGETMKNFLASLHGDSVLTAAVSVMMFSGSMSVFISPTNCTSISGGEKFDDCYHGTLRCFRIDCMTALQSPMTVSGQ